jgi:rhamnulokinase
VTGFWLLEECRRHWADPSLEELLTGAEQIEREVPVVDVDDDRLRAPDNMVDAYTELADMPTDAPPALVTRSIIESIAVRTADVTAQLGDVERFDDVILIGGAARMPLLIRRLAELTGRTVRVGAAEAAALGNAIVQGVALQVFTGIDEGRARIATSTNDGTTTETDG